jgi:hypothetical protein
MFANILPRQYIINLIHLIKPGFQEHLSESYQVVLGREKEINGERDPNTR